MGPIAAGTIQTLQQKKNWPCNNGSDRPWSKRYRSRFWVHRRWKESDTLPSRKPTQKLQLYQSDWTMQDIISKKQMWKCPQRDQCNPKMFNRTSVVFLSKKSSDRAKTQRKMKTEKYKELSRIRNGVETIPSILRRKYQIDHMPVRGILPTKLRFGIKLAALNVKKLFGYLNSVGQCALIPQIS